MKNSITVFLFFFLTATISIGQDDNEVIGQLGYTEEGKSAKAVMHSDITKDDGYTYLEVASGYSIVVKNKDRHELAKLINKYTEHKGKGKAELGSFKTHAVTGVTMVKSVTEPGKFETTYEKGTTITISYDGEDLWIHIPETNFLRYTAPPKDIRVFKGYIDKLFNAFNK